MKDESLKKQNFLVWKQKKTFLILFLNDSYFDLKKFFFASD